SALVEEIRLSEEEKDLERIRSNAYILFEHTYTAALAHLAMADGWGNKNRVMGVSSIILSVIAGSSLLSNYEGHELFTGLLSILISIIVAITTLLNPGKRKQEHFNAGANYLVLKNEVLLFYQVESMMEGKNDVELLSELSKLSKTRDELDKKSPRIPKYRFKKGTKDSQAEIKRTVIQSLTIHARTPS
ncbi:unnamed protein product, partial [marine sediment metagenome]